MNVPTTISQWSLWNPDTCGVISTSCLAQSGLSGGQRLVLEHVQRRAAQPAGFQRADERRLVDQAAPADVHQHRIILHQRQLALPDQADGLGRVRRGHDDDVGERELVGEAVRRHDRRDARRAPVDRCAA